MENNKEKFITLVRRFIKRPGVEQLLEYLETTDWYTAPCSTRFHSAYEGGLVEHSINVHRRLYQLYRSEKHMKTGNGVLTPDEEETVAVIGLFHDICKLGLYTVDHKNVKNPETNQWESVPFYKTKDELPLGHGEKSVIMLNRFIGLLPEEIYAIRWHMGFSDVTFKGGDQTVSKAFEICPLSVMAHLADMQATYLDESEAGQKMFQAEVRE